MSFAFLEEEPRPFSPPWALGLGLALGFYPLRVPPGAVLGAALAASAFGSALLGLGGRAPRLRAVLCFALALGLAAGATLRRDEKGAPRAALVPGPLRAVGVEGRLSADSTPTASGFRSYPLALESLLVEGPGLSGRVSAAGSCRLLVRGGPSLEAGARVEARGRPGDAAGPPAFFADGLELEDSGGPVAALRAGLRSRFRAALNLAGGEGAASGLLVALLMGDRGGLDLEEAADWKRAGCAHVLALSGQHLAILAALASLLAKPLLGPRKARCAALLLSLAFVFTAGASPSLLRSLLMYGLGALAFFADRPQSGRGILALAFVVALPLDPEAARSLSFELSYLALAGLVLLSPRFELLLLPVVPPFLAKALAAGLSAQSATAPLLALAFGTLYPAGLLASILSALLVAAFMWWGLGASLLCGLCPAFSALAAPVSRLLHGLLSGMMAHFAAWPELRLADPRGAALAAALVVLAAAFVYALPHAEYRIWLRGRTAREPPPLGRRRAGQGRRGDRRPDLPSRGPGPGGRRGAEARFGQAARPQVRLPGLPARPPRRGGSRDVEALRPELPREPDLPRAHTRGAAQGPSR